MISVNEAKSIITQHCIPLPPVRLSLIDACGLILSENVYAHTDIPAYPQSSMDGYAFRYVDINNTLRVIGEMAAGSAQSFTVEQNEAARIFTGAPVPEGADTVVMQENTQSAEGMLNINDPLLMQGANVRRKGAEIRAGELALQKEATLTVGALGFLASIGINEVPVYRAPSVTIIITGNELQEPGQQLAFGQAYDANSVMLSAALRKSGAAQIHVLRAYDTVASVENALNQGLQQSDMVLLSGGISVGDYDFVAEAASRCGVKRIFHRIRQKPGKPLYFGMKGNKVVFGLPGNPASALTCYCIYVLPAIKMMLRKTPFDNQVMAMLDKQYKKPVTFTHFLKAKLKDGNVTLLHAQESFRLHSFAEADCLAEFPEGRESYEAGEQIPVHLLTFSS